ncbi:conserved protein of unknown function [Pseudomonas marincola]|uniref:Uncharacterized protein n=1 Tax=Pseudomonas marincola TaxID=437900 RepID=A0A653E7N1_9PSED|nr:conserved protein of unknown function [Pseudomonas marincola]
MCSASSSLQSSLSCKSSLFGLDRAQHFAAHGIITLNPDAKVPGFFNVWSKQHESGNLVIVQQRRLDRDPDSGAAVAADGQQ